MDAGGIAAGRKQALKEGQVFLELGDLAFCRLQLPGQRLLGAARHQQLRLGGIGHRLQALALGRHRRNLLVQRLALRRHIRGAGEPPASVVRPTRGDHRHDEHDDEHQRGAQHAKPPRQVRTHRQAPGQRAPARAQQAIPHARRAGGTDRLARCGSAGHRILCIMVGFSGRQEQGL